MAPVDSTYSVRAALASVHAALGFLALLGHLWHAYRARSADKGLRFKTLFDLVAENSTLVVPANITSSTT